MAGKVFSTPLRKHDWMQYAKITLKNCEVPTRLLCVTAPRTIHCKVTAAKSSKPTRKLMSVNLSKLKAIQGK